jgi:protein TonB
MEAIMERPSHIIFDTKSHYLSRRLPLIGLAFSLQFASLWLFTHGLMSGVIHIDPHIIDVVKIAEPVKPRVEPPKPRITTTINTGKIEPPKFTIDRTHGGNSFPPPFTPTDPPTARGIDRAIAGIASTHTVPPYPPIARRIGVEGKVTLRLTVSAEGKVIAAEIVSSSGRDDMDQTAQQWIMAHWAYKPALDNGVPVVSHVLASVNFSLINQR